MATNGRDARQGARRVGGRKGALASRALRAHVPRLAARAARLEHRPAAVAWTPRACLPLRQRPCGRVGRSSGRLPRVRKYKADPGSGCSRHVVLVGSLAVCHPRLAGRDRRPRGLLSDGHELHRAGDHQPLGQPDDHDRHRVHGRGAVLGRRHPLSGPGGGRPPDVEVPRYGRRPARPDHEIRYGCTACLGCVSGDVEPGRSLRRDARRGLPALLQQAMERNATDPGLAGHAAGRIAGHAGGPRAPGGSLDSLAALGREA